MKLRHKKAIPRTFRAKVPDVLNRFTGSKFPVADLDALVLRILALAQTMCDRTWYPYQVQFTYRLVESILLRDGESVTALLSRQSGKTEGLAGVIVALLVILPLLAKKYPTDWRLNLTDDSGRYRGFRKGIRIGIYAPKADQAEIMFSRVKAFFETKPAKRVLKELHIEIEESNGDTLSLSNGSRLLCRTASENAKIEGQTHDLLILEEAQDLGDVKIKKSLYPMVASTKGTVVMIGTATTRRCTFYDTIQANERAELVGRRRNHFFYPHDVCERYNSLYRDYIDQQRDKIGEDSDEFQMAYKCQWIFERGMFVTRNQLFHQNVASENGSLFSVLYSPEQANASLPPNFNYVAAIDWGRDHDSTVLTVAAVDWLNPRVSLSGGLQNGMLSVDLYEKHIINWTEWIGDNYEHQFQEIQQLISRWGIRLKKIVTDANTAGQPIFDRLVALYADSGIEIVPCNFHAKAKSDGYKALYQEICGGRFTFPADKSVRRTNQYRKFINQMLDLRKTYKNGLMSVAHPDEKHAHDDYCFPATAPVVTDVGELPIAEIKPGMRVLTSQGFRRVLAAAQTGVRKLTRVGNLVGTGNHPIFNADTGMYPRLDSLMLDDTVLAWQDEKQSNTTAFASTATQNQNIDSCAPTSGHTPSGKSHQSLSTFTNGESFEALSLSGLSCITETETAATTESAISNFFLGLSINGFTPASLPELKQLSETSSKHRELHKRPNGTEHLPHESLPEFEPFERGKEKSHVGSNARNADKATRLSHLTHPSLVRRAVRGIVGDALTLRNYENMPDAEVPVFNLSVEGVNEFVCQGVLVHNCDSAMLANWGCLVAPLDNQVDFSDTNFFFR